MYICISGKTLHKTEPCCTCGGIEANAEHTKLAKQLQEWLSNIKKKQHRNRNKTHTYF